MNPISFGGLHHFLFTVPNDKKKRNQLKENLTELFTKNQGLYTVSQNVTPKSTLDKLEKQPNLEKAGVTANDMLFSFSDGRKVIPEQEVQSILETGHAAIEIKVDQDQKEDDGKKAQYFGNIRDLRIFYAVEKLKSFVSDLKYTLCPYYQGEKIENKTMSRDSGLSDNNAYFTKALK